MITILIISVGLKPFNFGTLGKETITASMSSIWHDFLMMQKEFAGFAIITSLIGFSSIET